MAELLLDTDIFSYLFKRDSRAGLYAPLLQNHTLCLSFMSVAEIKRWAITRQWGAPRLASLAETMKHYVVLPFDAAMTDAWARIAAHRARIGKPIGCGDCWIAASAIRHAIPLVTHNASHYSDIAGLRVETRAR